MLRSPDCHEHREGHRNRDEQHVKPLEGLRDVLGPGETKLLDSVTLIPVEAEERCRARLIAAGASQCLFDETALKLVEPDPARRQLEFLRQRTASAGSDREVRDRQLVRLAEQHGPLDRMAKLANVPRPGMRLQIPHRVGRNAASVFLELAVERVDGVRNELRAIAGPVAQRWQV